MRDQFINWDEILQTDKIKWPNSYPSVLTDRSIKTTKLEDMIFSELLSDRPDIQAMTEQNTNTIPLFKGLLQDVFAAIFSLSLRYNNPETVSGRAAAKNRQVLDELIKCPEFGELKSICEGQELPAFEACSSFSKSIADTMTAADDQLDRYMDILELLEQQNNDLMKKLSICRMVYPSGAPMPPSYEKKVVFVANKARRKQKQAEDIRQKIQECLIRNTREVQKSVSEAANQAVQDAAQTASILSAWGDGSGEMQNIPENRDLLKKAKSNPDLLNIARMLGQYREMLIRKRKNSYAYGLGEKYDISAGNDIGLCLSSELSLLGSEETQPLFLRKYHQKNLKQYRKRKFITKGEGDVIVCLDESTSMKEIIHWAKAFALTLLDIAVRGNRKFALIHFASANNIKVDVFEPGKFTAEDMMNAARHFFRGGTDFETPLSEAVRLLQNGFEKADISFITDGDCQISEAFTQRFTTDKMIHKFSVTGILINEDDPDAGASLIPFCDEIYRLSDLSADEIAMQVLDKAA